MLLHMNEMFRILIEIGKVGSSKELTLSCLASTGLFFFSRVLVMPNISILHGSLQTPVT